MLREAKMACPKTHRRVRTHIGVFLFVLVFWGGGGWVFCCYMNIVYLLALAWRIQPPGGLPANFAHFVHGYRPSI